MKKHMKGFTLVELLAVIVILAIVLIIAVPGVLSIINSTKQKGYESQLKMIKEAARNYVTAETSKISWVDQSDGSKQVVVTLTELQSNGYLDKKLIDPRDKAVITCADVTVKRDVNNKISYGVDATTCKPTDSKCFTLDKQRGAITGYDSTCPKTVKIPSEIDGKLVKSIDGYAFRDIQLTSVLIPEGVTYIGNYAFSGNQLTSVVIPNSVTEIGYNTFDTNQLTSVTIGSGITNIHDSAFSRNQLTNVTIPNNVTTIGSYVFEGNQLASVVIPNSVTYIRRFAFGGNKLTNVVIPNSVTYIGDYAFYNNKLISVVIPNSVKTIEYSAFNNNQLPEESAFIYKRNADGTEDKTTVVSYGGAKRDNPSIPNSVTTIGDYAFNENQLTSVTIPSSVTTIGEDAFGDNPLETIMIKGKSSLSEFASLAGTWYDGTPAVTFEP